MEEYTKLMSIQGKDEIQLVLPKFDMFCEEMKVFISNRDQNIYNRFAEIKIYNEDNFEISQSVI